MDRAGYIPKQVLNQLTHRNRYVNIPKMRKLGWITEKNQLISVKKILNTYNPDSTCANKVHITFDFKYLDCINLFKDYIFALTEQYILSGKYLSETRGYRVFDRDQRRYVRERAKRTEESGFKTVLNKYKPKKSGFETFSGNTLGLIPMEDCTLTSRISHSMLENWGYNSRTISRRRKGNINSYKAREFVKSDCEKKSHYNRKLKKKIKYLPIEVTGDKKKFFFANDSIRIHINGFYGYSRNNSLERNTNLIGNSLTKSVTLSQSVLFNNGQKQQ